MRLRFLTAPALLLAAGLAACSDGSPPLVEPPPAVAKTVWVDVSAGEHHTCGLASDSLAYCWGSNISGELGDGTTSQRKRAGAVSGGHRFRSIHAGGGQTCGVKAAGEVWCWGFDWRRASSLEYPTVRPLPVRIGGIPPIRDLELSHATVYAQAEDGRIFCWGMQCMPENPVPVELTTLPRLSDLDISSVHACGPGAGGGVVCWGESLHGALGERPADYDPERGHTVVMPGTRFTAAATAQDHSCALDTSGVLWCWGHNVFGALGRGTADPRDASTEPGRPPAPVVGDLRFDRVYAGGLGTCALTAANDAYCWGYNGTGQVGEGTTSTLRASPTPVKGGHRWARLSVGDLSWGWEPAYHVCGITTEGRMYCWGSSVAGAAGESVGAWTPEPVIVGDPLGS